MEPSWVQWHSIFVALGDLCFEINFAFVGAFASRYLYCTSFSRWLPEWCLVFSRASPSTMARICWLRTFLWVATTNVTWAIESFASLCCSSGPLVFRSHSLDSSPERFLLCPLNAFITCLSNEDLLCSLYTSEIVQCHEFCGFRPIYFFFHFCTWVQDSKMPCDVRLDFAVSSAIYCIFGRTFSFASYFHVPFTTKASAHPR